VIERKGKTHLTRKEASERLTAALGRGYTIRSIDRLIDSRVLSGQKFDGLQWVYIPLDKVEKLIESRPRQVPAPAPDPTPAPTRRRARKTAATR
jgi:hypothetical protein